MMSCQIYLNANAVLAAARITVVVAVLFVFTANAPADSLKDSQATDIVAMTFNIRIGAGSNNWGRSPYRLKDELKLDLEPVAKAIKSVSPDIVGLQEVYGESQARELARLLGMYYAYVPHGLGKNGGWWGVALLSRFPIDTSIRHEISHGWGNKKSVLKAGIEIFGKPVVVVVMHKDRDLKDGQSFRSLNKLIAPSRHLPVLLLGDLNIKPGDPRHTLFSPALVDTATAVDTVNARFARDRGTVIGPAMNIKGLRIDYVLVNSMFKVLDAGLVHSKHWKASDHLAYYAILRIQ